MSVTQIHVCTLPSGGETTVRKLGARYLRTRVKVSNGEKEGIRGGEFQFNLTSRPVGKRGRRTHCVSWACEIRRRLCLMRLLKRNLTTTIFGGNDSHFLSADKETRSERLKTSLKAAQWVRGRMQQAAPGHQFSAYVPPSPLQRSAGGRGTCWQEAPLGPLLPVPRSL